MVDFKNNIHDLQDAQEADFDLREEARSSDHFINSVDGMWDPHLARVMDDKPRYTFDRITPVIDQIMGEMSQAQFSVKVRPAGGKSSLNTARVYDGLIRNVEAQSNTDRIYFRAAREMITTGCSGWRIVTDWCDADSFDQDLQIKFISNFCSRVWFDPNYEEPTGEDANHCFIYTAMTKAAYDKKYPEGSGVSVGADWTYDAYDHKKPGQILIAERLYKVRKKRTLVLMSNNTVFELNDKFNQIKDEFASQGITVVRERDRWVDTVFSRKFDGDDWLESEKPTVFRYLPVVPVYGNFEISDNKTIYSGIVRKMKDANRVLNFAESRKIEEVALAPRGKYWATRKQVKNDLQDMEQLNVSSKSVQTYTFDENIPGPPIWQGSPTANPGLVETSLSAIQHIQASGGMFSSNMGDGPASRSGVAIDALQDRGNNGAYKYFMSLQTAIQHTGKVLVDSMPRVYDTPRELRVINPDGSLDMSVVNHQVLDRQTNKPVVINDLSQGRYDVVCDIGPAYKTRQEQSAKAIIELSKVDPSIIQLGGDVLLNNLSEPGIDQVAERKRWLMIKQGIIPKDQQTREEQIKLAKEKQEAQNKKPSPIEQAQLQIAQAELQKSQADIAEVQSKTRDRMDKLKLAMEDLKQKEREVRIKERESMLKITKEQNQQLLDAIKDRDDALQTQIDGLKSLIEATGADAVMSPKLIKAIEQQTGIVLREQQEL